MNHTEDCRRKKEFCISTYVCILDADSTVTN